MDKLTIINPRKTWVIEELTKIINEWRNYTGMKQQEKERRNLKLNIT